MKPMNDHTQLAQPPAAGQPLPNKRWRHRAALFSCLAAFAAGALAPAAHAGCDTVRIEASGGDDTDAIRSAIELAGPDGVVELGAGTFRISATIIVQVPLTIRGAGRNQTAVIADASLAPGGIYPNITEAERISVGWPWVAPFVFFFHMQEEDFNRFALRDLTVGVSGLTAPHFEGGDDAAERVISLVWVHGYNGFWHNSAGESPTDIGEIDAEHRVIPTMRLRCENVFFDGNNRDPAAPDAFHAFGMAGGFVFSHLDENGEEVIDYVREPVNADVSFKKCRFADLEGGISLESVIGRDDPYWTFGPEPVEGAITLRECDFKRVGSAVEVFDLSDTRVVVKDCSFRECDTGIYLSNAYNLDVFEWIGWPEPALCTLLVEDSDFRDGGFADVWVEEFSRGHTVDARIRDCQFRLDGEVGIRFDGSQGAVVRDCDFRGSGEAGIYALDAEELRLFDNDFCHLDPSNPGEASVTVAGTTTIVDSHNDCLDFFTEP